MRITTCAVSWGRLSITERRRDFRFAGSCAAIQHGIENSLDAKLDAAFDALDGASAQNDIAAIDALGAFINAVKSGKAIPVADANALIAAAQKIIDG
jgi:hypothetical protein